MAKIEMIDYGVGVPLAQINVTATVGANGVNNKNDVIVVQALLKYALEQRNDFRNAEFPEPCGAFVKTTAQLIKKYQRWINRNNGKRVSIDGRIDPAKGVFAFGSNKMWTIWALNNDALEIALLNGHEGNFIEAICQRWTFLRAILNKSTVGSLDLELA